MVFLRNQWRIGLLKKLPPLTTVGSLSFVVDSFDCFFSFGVPAFFFLSLERFTQLFETRLSRQEL